MYKRKDLGWEKHLDFILIDALSTQLAFAFCFYIYQVNRDISEIGRYRNIAVALFALSIFASVIFDTMNNVVRRGYFVELVQAMKQAAIVYAGLIFLLFFTGHSSEYNHLVLTFIAIFHFLISYTFRILWKRILRIKNRTGEARKSMILVANEENVPSVLAGPAISEDARIVGLVLSNRNAEGETVQDLPVVANLDNAALYICREWVDEVFFYPDSSYDKEDSPIYSLIRQCRQMAIPTHIRIPFGDLEGKSFIDRKSGFDVITTTANYASPLQLFAKRCLDILGGLVGSVLALLLMLIIGPIIKSQSPGPILFRQERIGQNGKHFKMYKLRSMYVDAEERKKEFLSQNRVPDARMFKLDFDPRVIGNEILPDGTRKTGIGDFIRRTSLDEFPQFFNVLKGEMSLVGTRPPTLDEWEKYEYHHRARLSIRPGVTGMWQVSGRSKITDFEEIVRLDTEYINNWSIGLDIKLILITIISILRRDGAM